ncbi:transposase [Mycolicibacterium novocastrense]|uniref:Transposase n=1 Tax=Mycolicibacterium novocastrense TaxID=59813 RepID=A0ABQ0KCZ4_MYCNV|nr:transposase [Mycolicibacterium novocastrense]
MPRAHRARLRNRPENLLRWLTRPPSARTLWDTVITEVLAGFYEPDEHGRRKPESLYGATKMWAHLQCQGIAVARCTVERLMWANGWHGITRRKKIRTTNADPTAARAADLVKRQFRVPAPNVLLVADFTYVRLSSGAFVYTALAVDAYAGRIVGWTCSASKEDRFVRQAIRHAAQLRLNEGNPLLATLFITAMQGLNTLLCGSGEPCAVRIGGLDRHGRGCLRQRSGGDDHRALQDRSRPRGLTVPARPPAPPGRRRTAHRRVGALVQHRPAHAPPGPHPTYRIRDHLLRYKHSRDQRLHTNNRCASNPRRFILPEDTTAASILDRLLHHASIVVTSGESYRMR